MALSAQILTMITLKRMGSAFPFHEASRYHLRCVTFIRTCGYPFRTISQKTPLTAVSSPALEVSLPSRLLCHTFPLRDDVPNAMWDERLKGYFDMRIAGVLWLNTSLTVGAHKAGSHKGHWEQFTDKVLKEAVKNSKGVVVMAWGAWAQKRASALDSVRSTLFYSCIFERSNTDSLSKGVCAEETSDII